eukprot:3935283-Prymnesium_polylepis.1
MALMAPVADGSRGVRCVRRARAWHARAHPCSRTPSSPHALIPARPPSLHARPRPRPRAHSVPARPHRPRTPSVPHARPRPRPRAPSSSPHAHAPSPF